MGRVVLLLLLAACSKPGNESEAKQWADHPPAKDVPIPDKLEIAVTVDGAKQPAITAVGLRAAKPDFADEERKAWRIPTLVPAAAAPGVVEAFTPTGISVSFPHPTPDGLEPVLFLTRRGEVIVAALNPKDPVPGHHGQGGRLHRPGDSSPRVAPVAHMAITRSKP